MKLEPLMSVGKFRELTLALHKRIKTKKCIRSLPFMHEMQ